MFERIVVVNRGEAAMRLINAVTELRAEGATPVVIALHTPEERRAMFVREADEAIEITSDAGSPYLDYAELERALIEARADAVWVGWGFVAEHAEFADLVDRLGITFIGPSGEVMRRLGDKIGAKLLAESVGVPVAPWSGGAVTELDGPSGARAMAETIGFPLMVKAAAGGGGRGIRRVDVAEELPEALERAMSEGEKSFGDSSVFMERVVTNARHIEVQIAADVNGNVWALGVRDCSVQRRNQKVIEESSSTALTREQEDMLCEAAERLAQAAEYRNVGTVEFLYQPDTGEFAFLEVNTRLQVEHTVTEITTGVDLVLLQLQLAAGWSLSGAAPVRSGHAIEARLNAEDTEAGFAPAPGHLRVLRFAGGPGVRVDTGFAEGDAVSSAFDSMIAKIIASGTTRDEARRRLRRAIAQTTVVIDGGVSNKSFLLDLLDTPEFAEGSITTNWLDLRLAEGGPESADPDASDAVSLSEDPTAAMALIAAAIDAAEREHSRAVQAFLRSAARGRPADDARVESSFELRIDGERYRVDVARLSPRTYGVGIDGHEVEVDYEPMSGFESRLTFGGRRHRVVSMVDGAASLVEVDGRTHRVSLDDGGAVRSPAPSLVVSVLVAPGATVARGEPLVVVEAMKVETTVAAPFDGTVVEILTAPNMQVDAGEPLVRLDATTDDESVAGGVRIDMSLLDGAPSEPEGGHGDDHGSQAGVDELVALLEEMRWFALGFDAPLGGIDRAVARYRALRAGVAGDANGDQDAEGDEHPASTPELTPTELRAVHDAEVEVLRAFADVVSLSRNRPADEVVALETHSPQEYFHRFLRALDADAEGLSEAFRQRLDRSLAHYGVDRDQRGSELEEAAFGIFRAQRSAAERLPMVLALLGSTPPGHGADEDTDSNSFDSLRSVLSDLVVATQVRFPRVGEAARSLRFATFDAPAIEAGRRAALDQARVALDQLASDPEVEGRPSVMAELVASPHRLIRLFCDRDSDGSFVNRKPLVEVLTRRNYQIRKLEQFRIGDFDGQEILTVSYLRGSTRFHVVAGLCELAALGDATAALASVANRAPKSDTVVVDLYVRADSFDSDADALSDSIAAQLDQVGLGSNVARVAVSGSASTGEVAHFTYRTAHGAHIVVPAATTSTSEPADTEGPAAQEVAIEQPAEAETSADAPADGETAPPARTFVEDTVVRGLHPMIAQRLQVGRLSNFDVTRLPSSDDTYLFQIVGRDNPADVRLFAAAEIRDFTIIRDASGRIVALPELEQVLTVTLASMRRHRNALPDREQPSWNRAMLYVWPIVDVPVEDFTHIANRLAPLTENIGLEDVRIQAQVVGPDGEPTEIVARFSDAAGGGLEMSIEDVPDDDMQPLDAYSQKLIAARRRGAPYPFEIVPMLTGSNGVFIEYDITDADDGTPVFAPVDRERGLNTSGVVVGLVSTATDRHPDGMVRVAIFGDPTKALGNLAEAECSRILGAIDLAEMLDAPIEWFALSAGARIAMDSGTENMDWISKVLRRIVEFTQDGREINIIVTGINVGAQPYWNAEATMLMHTSGILVMTPQSAMVLTGKQSLDYSGGVSAEDNHGIGGFDRIMGPNGQAQYWAPDLRGAIDVLFDHYRHAYLAPGERFPRAGLTNDPTTRDITDSPHRGPGTDFTTVGDVFSDEANPGRKKPFDIRSVLQACADQDLPPLERWAPMRDAETVVVYDAHLGGQPVTLLGVESRPMPRHGLLPADGPDQWTAGTLFPLSSKKMARAINAASGNRPVVVLANLSGFDGSPESLSRLQLEFGAEIGRAVVNFDGPIVFCVVSRFHGGAFVVFSGALNDNMQVLAVEGTHASVLGGAPAAAVVFAGDVRRRVNDDARVVALEQAIVAATSQEAAAALRAELIDVRAAVHSEKLGEVATEFDSIHSIERARDVGSVDEIIPAAELRPRLIAAVQKGMDAAMAAADDEPPVIVDRAVPEAPSASAFAAALDAARVAEHDAAVAVDASAHWLDDLPGFIASDDPKAVAQPPVPLPPPAPVAMEPGESAPAPPLTLASPEFANSPRPVRVPADYPIPGPTAPRDVETGPDVNVPPAPIPPPPAPDAVAFTTDPDTPGTIDEEPTWGEPAPPT